MHTIEYAFARYLDHLRNEVGPLSWLVGTERELHAEALRRDPTASKSSKLVLLEQLAGAKNISEYAAAGRLCHEQCESLLGTAYASHVLLELSVFPVIEALKLAGVPFATIIHKNLWRFPNLSESELH